MRLRVCNGIGVLAIIVAFAACIPAAARRGDAAAARGDWREAEAAYREAVQGRPNDVELAKKYNEAKANAITMALRTAEACRASNDAACIDRELSYALSLDPTNAHAASLRSEARKQLAANALEQARAALHARNPTAVWRHLEQVRSYGVPQGSEEEVARLDAESATTAEELARGLLDRARSQNSGEAVGTLTQARELAAGAASRNAQYASTLAEIDEARRRAIAAEIEVQTKLGEAAITQEDWVGAVRAFASAYRASGDSRHQRRASYAESMRGAQVAIAQRSFGAAAGYLRAAISTQEDRGAAQTLLDGVEPRVYKIRLESIAISPTKPGTNTPWVGKPWWSGAAPIAAAAAATWSAGPMAGKVAYDVTNAVTSVPPENRPGLIAFIDLPDGRRLKTEKVKGIYVIFGAEFSLYANNYDTRAIRISVYHERSGGNDSVAVANVPLGAIVAGRIDAAAIRGDAQALQQVVFTVDPVDGWQDGSVGRVKIQDQGENRASARSIAGRGLQRVQLLSASLVLPSEGGDGDGSSPDPYVEVYQGSKQVLKTSTAQDTRSTEWSFKTTDLFLDPNEQLVVKLTDSDFASDDQIATWVVPARDVLSGQAQLTTVRGTVLRFRTSRRNDRPR